MSLWGKCRGLGIRESRERELDNNDKVLISPSDSIRIRLSDLEKGGGSFEGGLAR